MILVVLFTALWGLSWGLTRSVLLDAPRERVAVRLRAVTPVLGELVTCPACLGFWLAGVVVLALRVTGIGASLDPMAGIPTPVVVTMAAFAQAGVNVLATTYLDHALYARELARLQVERMEREDAQKP